MNNENIARAITNNLKAISDLLERYCEINEIDFNEISFNANIRNNYINAFTYCGGKKIKDLDVNIMEPELFDEEDDSINIKLDDNVKAPTKAHKTDAGYDLYSNEDKMIPAKGSAIFHTGVHIELPINTVGMLKSKSGLNVNYGITSEGVIDVGYTGEIVVKLYNHSNDEYWVSKGDKISQLVVMPIVSCELNQVDELNEAERGDNGFGSSGK